MLQNANKPTSNFAYSIAAGIEKGAKNRYNNIWPYDHARVKLGARKGECDYINASFVQADELSTRYIATQGPMPATYEDFWKVIWEQNCSVIVMLTKEEEAGRVSKQKHFLSAFFYFTNGKIFLILISLSLSLFLSTA